MRSNRVITIAVLLGVVIVAVTFLGAAHMTGDDTSKSAKDNHKSGPAVKSGSIGVVVFGLIDVDDADDKGKGADGKGAGLLSLYPETFPQPSKVIKVLVAERETVVKGQKLIELDPELAELKVKQAEAALAEAEASLQRANAAVKGAEEMLQAHQVLVQTTAKAVEGKAGELSAAKVTLEETKRKLDVLKAENDPEYRAAKKNYDAAEKALEAEKIKLDGMKAIVPTSKLDDAKGLVAAANAAISRQQAMLKEAQVGLRMMTLTAPIDGKIIRSTVAVGQTFGPQTRQPALLLLPNGKFIVRAEVDQEFASRVAVDQKAVIHDEGNSALKWTGKVLRISDAFLPKRNTGMGPEGLLMNDSRVLECIVSIEGNDPIRIGQRVRVSIGIE